jgi:ABC-type nitrate/sulfonate/bicarbonate transport system permease component
MSAGHLRLLITIGIVVLIELACRSGLISPRSMVPPTIMASSLFGILQTAEFWRQLSGTVQNIVVALGFAVVAGFAGGVVLSGMPRVRRAVEPLISSYYALPFFVLYPLFISLFGMNSIPITVVGFLYAVMAMVTGTLAGLDRIPQVLSKLGRTFRMGAFEEALKIKLPAAAPFVFSGVKLALGYAITGVIGSEFILSNGGIGYAIAFAYNDFEDKTMYGLLLFVIIAVSIITILMHRIERSIQYRAGTGRTGQQAGKAPLLQRLAAGAIIAFIILAVWHVLFLRVGQEALASPAMAMTKLVRLIGQPEFWQNTAETARALGLSLLISCVAGTVLGVALGSSRRASDVAEPMLVTLYALPKVTLYPVVLLFFGIGLSAKVAFGAMYGMIPMTILTMDAIRNMNPTLLRTARVMRLTVWQTFAFIKVPATIPEIVSGLRISFSITLLGVMIGEMFASRRGLGFMIMNSIGVNDTATMMAITVLIGLFAVVVNTALIALDDRIHRGQAVATPHLNRQN